MASSTTSFNKQPLCLLFLLISSIIFSIFFSAISAQPNDDVYIIHMDPSAMPKAFSTHHSWYMATLDSISSPKSRLIKPELQKSKLSSNLVYTYNHVINGFSAVLSSSELSSLESANGFIYATRDKPVKLDTTHSFEFLGLNPNSDAWATTNFGDGVIIGMVDTGVWPESKSFSDDGMGTIPSKWKGECETGTQFNSSLCNKKLIGARSFNKGLLAHFPNITIAMNSPRDTSGHGTHTSSTAAGNFVEAATFFGYSSGTARGMAPRAHVAMYKVSDYESDIIAAIEKAVKDGVDILSLSLGQSHVPLYGDPIAIASFGAVRQGVFVSTSAGNEGPFDGSVHNGTPWVLTVASGTLDRKYHAILDLDNGVSFTGQSLYLKDYLYTNKFMPIVLLDSCNNSKLINDIGKFKIVVCESGHERLGDQVDAVNKTEVAGAIFISNNTNLVEIFIQSTYPAIFMNPKEGENIKNTIKNSKGEQKARMEFKKTVLGTKPAPKVSGFSSRGPSLSCRHVLKPDVTAPGDHVLASWPDNVLVNKEDSPKLFSKFNMISGTSMACPHASGIAALVKATHPDWSPAAIRSAIMTSSDIADNTGHPISDMGDEGDDNGPVTATPLAMGSGHINPNKALNPGLIYNVTTQDYVNLMCAMNFTAKQLKIITGTSSPDCSSPSLDLNYPSFIGFFNANNKKLPENSTTVREFKRMVTHVRDGPASYVAKVIQIKGFKINVYPEKLEFTKKNEKKSFELKIEGPRLMKEHKLFGYLTWEDSVGNYVVRSPIVVTRLSSDDMFKN